MCGIIAIYTRRRDNLEQRARAALALLENRGPDSQEVRLSGLHHGDNGHHYYGAIGVARLAIVDVEGPTPPLATPDGRYRIGFHGEIWNYRDLRTELVSGGATFQTSGDTEVVLHTVANHHDQAPHRLRGQFAYVVEDTHEGIVYAARDPNGICPLFYAINEEREFILGSTVNVLLQDSVDGQQLRALPQGYSLTYDAKTGRLQFNRYYDITAAIRPGTDAPPIDSLRTRLCNTIHEKIPREVPYATIVGGIDSSFVTTVCSRSDRPPSCIITVTTTEDTVSADVRNARLLSERCGIEARIGLVDEEYILKNLERVIDMLGSSNFLEVVTGIVGLKAAEMAREAGAKAIITGGGADEMFGGYDFVWTMFELDSVEQNLLHVYQQSGMFECHREDSVTAAVGIEARPAYYDTDLAELLFSLPVGQRIVGLGTQQVTEKAILKQIAYGHLPRQIINAKKSPLYESTAVVQLFEKVAARMMTRKEAARWKKQSVADNALSLSLMLSSGTGPVLVHKIFTERFPGLRGLRVPYAPPDYNDPNSYGRFHGAFGSPLMEGFKWYRKSPATT
ncbi:MAG: hypothetical protein GTO22_03295 [Gemmatimonadales bacterium]|nr:hypothetical protein [Gemmatimonadales bacterium]